MQQRKNNNTIRVLVIDDRMEDAESIVTGLRNDGLAVRASRPTSVEEYREMLAGQPVDLVLASATSKTVEPTQALTLARATGNDLPVVILIADGDDAGLATILGLGADNIALRNRDGHIRRAVEREYRDLRARRDLRHLDARLHETERRCDALIDSSRDPIAYIHEGMHIRANQAYLEMFGYEDFDEVEGMSILDMVAPADAGEFKALLKQLSKGGDIPPLHHLTAQGADGQEFPATMEFSPATYDGESCLQIIFRRKEASIDPEMIQQMESLRRQDVATGLLNRPTFLQSLEDAVARSATAHERHGLLLVQPDHFNTHLQSVGINNADALMAALAERLRPLLGDNVEAARFGEQVIAVLARGYSHGETEALANRIVAAVAERFLDTGDHSLTVTVSVGAVQVSERNAQVPRVLARAHELLETAQGVGGGRMELYDPGALDRAEQDRINAWIERIRSALEHDQLILHYQPIISLHGNGAPFFDVLMRMDNGTGELVMPTAFVGIAEEHGLIRDLDRGVIAKAVRTLAANAKRELRFIVRISRASIEDPTLPDFIQQVLQEHGVPANRLIVQINESKVSTQINEATVFNQKLAAFGAGFCVDQFGVGLNSAQLIAHLRPRFIKLDGSFMTDYARSPEQQARVKDLASAGSAVGAATIACDVNDSGSMTTLFLAGVEFVQGNFLAPASPDLSFDF
ncbi:MAG: EAL domain-containing protein [Proteobacteria bacterium]|nr:EAL domain-containing protein [Pseudomonadota bacterium]